MRIILASTSETALRGDVYLREYISPTSKTASKVALRHIPGITNTVVGPRTLTLILELNVDEQPDAAKFYVKIVPNEAMLYSKRCPQILFDRQFPLTPDTTSTSVALSGSGRFVLQTSNGYWMDNSIVRGYNFQILPTRRNDRNLSCFDGLPSNVLLEVAGKMWEGTEKHDFQAAKDILSMALVCKAWKVVILVYFQKVGSQDGYKVHNVGGLVESLRRQHQMRRHITTISSHNIVPCEEYTALCKEFIICAAPYLINLEIPHSIYNYSKTILAILPTVRALRVFNDGGRKNYDDHIDTLPEVYALVKNWANLEDLEVTVSIPGVKPSREKRLKADSRAFSAPFSLKELSLHGPADDPQPRWVKIAHIRYFLTSTPTLHTLQLTDFQGLSNKDVRGLLMSLSSTLECLVILRCIFHGKGEEEEEAIDAVIPHFSKIRFLWTNHPLATPLAIGRKPRCVDHTYGSCCGVEWSMFQFGDYESVLDALEVTGWSTVQLNLSDDMRPTESMLARWYHVTKQRSIILAVDYSKY